LKRKLAILSLIEVFFKLHSTATEGKKDKKQAQKSSFLPIEKIKMSSLNIRLKKVFLVAYICGINRYK
jgi:hypothetical protein